MKTAALTKEIKAKIESFDYQAIDEAINLAAQFGTKEFFDKFLGELQLRCERYNKDHVCSESKFFNRGMRGKASHFTYRALVGLVNVACEGSKAHEFRQKMTTIYLIGHVWENGEAFGGNVDLKYISNFESISEIQIEEAGTISNIEVLNNFKNLKKVSIYGANYNNGIIPYSLKNIPNLTTNLCLPNFELNNKQIEEICLSSVKKIESLDFLKNLKKLKSLQLMYCEIQSFSGIPDSLENFSFTNRRSSPDLKDNHFNELSKLSKLKILQLESDISDFSFLSELSKLEQLTITSESERVSIPNLKKSSNLVYISAPKGIDNLDFIESNSNILFVDLSDSNITSITGLKNCKNLKVIQLKNCKFLKSLNGLAQLKNLDIRIKNTPIINLNGLSGCSTLSKFNTYIIEDFNKADFASTEIENYSDGSNNLDYVIGNNTFYISDCNHLLDTSGIGNCLNLMGLSITDCNSLTAINGIEKLTNLYDIDLSNCVELTDIKIVKQFPKLKFLNLSGCKKIKPKPTKPILENRSEVEEYIKQL